MTLAPLAAFESQAVIIKKLRPGLAKPPGVSVSAPPEEAAMI
jgi:hypothetical protein